VLELEKNEQSSLAAGGGKTQLKNPQADTTSALAVESKFPSESSPAAETEISGDLNPAMKMNQGLGRPGRTWVLSYHATDNPSRNIRRDRKP
jgi:hypothetical protein